MLPAIIIVAVMAPAATREFDENLIMEMKMFGENGGESMIELFFFWFGILETNSKCGPQ